MKKGKETKSEKAERCELTQGVSESVFRNKNSSLRKMHAEHVRKAIIQGELFPEGKDSLIHRISSAAIKAGKLEFIVVK